MSPLRGLYLALALVAAALSLATMLQGLAGHGDAAYRDTYYLVFVPDWNGIIVAISLSVWAIAETALRRNWSALVAIPATILLGPGCGLPLYLFLRTRPVV